MLLTRRPAPEEVIVLQSEKWPSGITLYKFLGRICLLVLASVLAMEGPLRLPFASAKAKARSRPS